VEDEPVTRLILCKILEVAGFTVFEARDGLEALERFRADGEEIFAVVLDVVMPRLGGQETLNELRHLRPQLPALVVSGLEAGEVKRRFPDCESFNYLRKPVSPEGFVKAVEELLASAG
jgi:CheY-like chemotaxis protein